MSIFETVYLKRWMVFFIQNKIIEENHVSSYVAKIHIYRPDVIVPRSRLFDKTYRLSIQAMPAAVRSTLWIKWLPGFNWKVISFPMSQSAGRIVCTFLWEIKRTKHGGDPGVLSGQGGQYDPSYRETRGSQTRCPPEEIEPFGK